MQPLRELAHWGEGLFSHEKASAAEQASDGPAALTEETGGDEGVENDEDEDAVLQLLEERRRGGEGASVSDRMGGSMGSSGGARELLQAQQVRRGVDWCMCEFMDTPSCDYCLSHPNWCDASHTYLHTRTHTHTYLLTRSRTTHIHRRRSRLLGKRTLPLRMREVRYTIYNL